MPYPTLPRTTVLVVDGTDRTARFASWLQDDYHVREANSKRAALDHLDNAVRVVLLRDELATSVKTAVREATDDLRVDCRLALTTSLDRPVLYPDVACDFSICEPITAATLLAAADRLYRRSWYIDAMRRHYKLSMRLTIAEISPESDDSKADMENIRTEMHRIGNLVEEIGQLLDADDARAVTETLQGGDPFSKPHPDRGTRIDKYRPDSCSDCRLPWGTYHGDDLGWGYSPLGAFTWRCNRCHTIQNVPTPSNRSVARRRF